MFSLSFLFFLPQDRMSNAKYALSMARMVGAPVRIFFYFCNIMSFPRKNSRKLKFWISRLFFRRFTPSQRTLRRSSTRWSWRSTPASCSWTWNNNFSIYFYFFGQVESCGKWKSSVHARLSEAKMLIILTVYLPMMRKIQPPLVLQLLDMPWNRKHHFERKTPLLLVAIT